MKPLSDTDTLIDRYLRGDLTDSEIRAFAQRVMAEPDLAEELELRMDIIIGIRAAERRMIRERLMCIAAGLPSPEEENARPINRIRLAFAGQYRWWWIAATAALAAGGGAAVMWLLLR